MFGLLNFMALSKDKKKEIISNIGTIIKSSGTVVFVNHNGLTVSEIAEMRREMKKDGVSFVVAKKSLARKAFDTSGIGGTAPDLPGQLAFAFGEDAVASARLCAQSGKKYEGKISMVGGIFENQFKDSVFMKEISSIPPLHALRGMFVDLINSPIQGLVVALSKIGEAKQS